MNRRDITLAFLALGAAPLAAFSQTADKLYRVGYLGAGGAPQDGAPPASLRAALRDLGYVEGKNITYTGRWADAKQERLPELAAELVALKVDAILTLGGPATVAAKKATTTIPIVMTGSGGDAVATGMIASLARPGGNITGMSDDAGTLSAKRMEILKEAVPKAKRIAAAPACLRTSPRCDRDRSGSAGRSRPRRLRCRPRQSSSKVTRVIASSFQPADLRAAPGG